MPKVQPTQTINVDGIPYVVDKLSPQLKQAITMMDEWRQEEVDMTGKLTMIKAALRDLQNNIYIMIKKEHEQAESADVNQQKASNE